MPKEKRYLDVQSVQCHIMRKSSDFQRYVCELINDKTSVTIDRITDLNFDGHVHMDSVPDIRKNPFIHFENNAVCTHIESVGRSWLNYESLSQEF